MASTPHLPPTRTRIDTHKPPNFTLPNLHHPLLARLETCTSMPHLTQLHAQLITTGLSNSTFAATRLLAFSALSPNGDLAYASLLFRRLSPPNTFAWNAMVRAFASSDRPEEALLMYLRMLEDGRCFPDEYTFPFLFKACARFGGVGKGRQVHGQVVKNGLMSDCFVANSLIRFYAAVGFIGLAEKVFERMPLRDEASWGTMIGGLANAGLLAEALRVFELRNWREKGVDEVTMGTVLSVCAKLKDLEFGREIHSYIERGHLEMGLILGNCLMNMYAKCGRPDDCLKVFEGMLEVDSISWTTLVSAYLEDGRLERCLELMVEMKASNVKADVGIFLSLISACDSLDFGVSIHDLVVEVGFQSNLSVCSALIDMYSRTGAVELARAVFDGMPVRDIVAWNSMISSYTRSSSMLMARALFDQMPRRDNYSWSTMISGYVKEGYPEKAMGLYHELSLDSDIEPDEITISSTLIACSHLGLLEEGESIHLYLKRKLFHIDATLGSGLLDMYVKSGCVEKAIQVFDALPEKNVHVWTALISGLAMHGRGMEALTMFREMQSSYNQSMMPNSVTYLSVLSACTHAGLVEDGLDIYRHMQENNVEPDERHHGCVVDLLARAGMLKEAIQFIERLGPEADVGVWGALLGACRIHGDIKLGKVAAKKMLELDPTHDGARVAMSNIYANVREWSKMKEVRKKMIQENVVKEVGRSWIVLNGIRHDFTAGEMSSYQAITCSDQ